MKGLRCLVACSGGPDSMALLDAVDVWRKRSGTFVAVGHVDHGWRGKASRDDARFVDKECARRGLPCRTVRAPVNPRFPRRGGEEGARQRRYRALAGIANHFRCPVVATAHTLDDQVETVFLNLIRGSGPSGLAGMAPVSPWPVPVGGSPPRLFRPLLEVSKQEIMAYLRARRLSFRVDQTNADPSFLRNRLRPILKAWDALRPGMFKRIARTAGIIRDEESYWSARFGFRRKGSLRRLERGRFLRYHIAEQRRFLRRHCGLARFDALERVREFAGNAMPGPLDVPGAKVVKTSRFLYFRRSDVSPKVVP